MKRRAAFLYFTLLANVAVFFHKPLFSSGYLFPWDFRGVQLPLVTFLAEQLQQNHFALWNPFSYCGYPIFANIEAGFFHPLVLASAFLSSRISLDCLPVLLEWSVVLQVWFAGIAAYHLWRELGVGQASAWTGAIVFETGGYFASQPQHIGAMMAVAWMPLAWLAVLRLSRNSRPRWLAILAAALGMSILGGFPQPTLAVFVSTAVLSLVVVALRLSRPHLIAYTACACALGILLASAQFIPTAQLERYSVARYRADWLSTGGGLYWQSLVSLVSPNHYHIFDPSHFQGPGDLTFLYLYCSIAGLVLALFALLTVRHRNVALLAAMALFGLFWMLGDKQPLWRALYPLLPEKIRIGIHPEYTYCILTLAIAGLAAIGLDRLRVPEPFRWAAGIVIAADLFLVGSGRPMNLVSIAEEPGVTRESFNGDKALLKTLRGFVNRDYPPSRIDTVDTSMFWSISAPISHVPSAGGVSPMALADIIQLRLLLHDGARWGWYYPVEKIDSPVLDLMNVKYLVASPAAGNRLRAPARFRQVASFPGNEIFENLTVMPRCFLVHTVVPAASPEEARHMIERGGIDLHHAAIIFQSTQDRSMELAPAPAAGEEVKVLEYQPTVIDLSVRSRGSSLLVVSENDYPGWKAWVDGKPAPIYRADIAFRGVIVPDGGHRVRMEFNPVILPVSVGLSIATAILLVFLTLRDRARYH